MTYSGLRTDSESILLSLSSLFMSLKMNIHYGYELIYNCTIKLVQTYISNNINFIVCKVHNIQETSLMSGWHQIHFSFSITIELTLFKLVLNIQKDNKIVDNNASYLILLDKRYCCNFLIEIKLNLFVDWTNIERKLAGSNSYNIVECL